MNDVELFSEIYYDRPSDIAFLLRKDDENGIKEYHLDIKEEKEEYEFICVVEVKEKTEIKPNYPFKIHFG